jgi:hypothetical protein
MALLADEARAVVARGDLWAYGPAAMGAEIHDRSLSDGGKVGEFRMKVEVAFM